MNLHGKLFIKTFIGFWLVTVVILASWVLISDYFDARPGDDRDAGPRPGPPHRFMLQAMYNLQNMNRGELPGLVDKIHRDYGVDIYLIRPDESELLSQRIPPGVVELARELEHGRQRLAKNTAHGHLLGHNIYRRDAGLLHTVFRFPPPRYGFLDTLGHHLWLRIGITVLISGLVCFVLSRLLTNRLRALQHASRRLADGDLDVRLQTPRRGGDETDELARGFNSMAKQLQARIQEQKRLLGDVSHELRSPIARLRVALALAQEDRENTDSYLSRIERETERLEQLIGQLLSSQSGVVALNRRVDLIVLLSRLCADANFEGQTSQKGVRLDTSLTHAEVASAGDLLDKAFDNILRNALAYTDKNTEVTISVERVDGSYRVRVTDCGGGVPEAELESIFGEFYRVDTARSRESGGHGLGLAIARRAIAMHRGSITADNTENGLCITVVLPVPPPV